jgi:hypothetical protein
MKPDNCKFGLIAQLAAVLQLTDCTMSAFIVNKIRVENMLKKIDKILK